MRVTPLLEAKAELTHGSKSNCPVVLSSRVRLARNLEDYPFPGWAKESHRREILTYCFDAIEGLPQMRKGTRFTIDELNDLEKQILMERHLISRELMNAKENAGVFISKDQSCAIMINEEDHLRIQQVRSGFNFKRIWRTINELDSAIEEHLNYAFSSDLGYLTACPTNVGTGLRASAMMHLPALTLSNQMEKVVRAVNQLGIAVRGQFGEGSEAVGSIFQISNQQTLGEGEEEIIKRLTNVLSSIIEQENNARQKLLETDPSKIFDKIGRAYGILKFGRVLSSTEALKLLSLLRFAVDLKVIDEGWRQVIDRLLIVSQPGHIQYTAKRMIEPQERDVFRSSSIREQFAELLFLNFDKTYDVS